MLAANLILLLIVMVVSWVLVYKMTKMGIIDDAINFVKSKLNIK